MLKKYIDKNTIKDVPQNGIILVDIEQDGEIIEISVGVSNIPLAFDKDVELAHKNGYYEYIEEEAPIYDEETQYLSYEYILENNTIIKKWFVVDSTTGEVVENATN
jgi:hypothetical protein